MHEASLMTDLMRKIDAAAQQQRARRVVGVSVWLGALSHMSADHFREHFAQASTGTMADGAALDITVSDDIHHAQASDVRLESLEVDV